MKTKRQRWYRIQHRASFIAIIEKIKSLPYSEEHPIGFEIVETSQSRLIARYIEQQLVSSVIRHPFGEIEETTTIKYTIFYFEIIRILKELSIIKVLNPPVSLKGFVKKLVDICTDGFSISRIHFELDKVYMDIVSNPSIDRYSVKKLSVSSIPFSKKTIARLNLRSSGNAYEELRRKYKSEQYKLDKIYLEARVNGTSESIEISYSGSVICTLGFEDLVEKYVINLLNPVEHTQ